MSLRIQNNVEALTAHRQLNSTTERLRKSMERLSSGYRINKAADDAAGLAISEKMRAQIRGLAQAQRNAQDAVSMVQTAESALSEVHEMLQRVRELAVQYHNGTLSAGNRASIQSEVDQLYSEIQRIAQSSQFNGISLLAGNGSVTFQIGANDGEVISVSTLDLVGALGTAPFSLSVTNTQDLTEIDTALDVVSSQRAQLGAVQNRLEHLLNSIAVYHENLVAAESRIRDLDMAQEAVELTKLQVLQQAGTAMLAQANQSNSSVLQLLRGG